jgi:hypothetical protein
VSRSSLLADVITYNLKVWAAGLAAAVFVPLSLAGLVVDLVFGTTDAPESLARRVLAASARFEAALDVHGDLTDVRVTGDADAHLAAA